MSDARPAARGPGGGARRARPWAPPRPATPAADGDDSSSDPGRGRRPLAMLLSLVVALTLWFTFSMRESYTLTVTVPIEVASLPEGQALRRPPPRTVQAQVQGEGWTLLSFSQRVPPVRVAAAAPQLDVASALRASGLPTGLSVVGAQPRTVALALDRRTTRRVPVRLVSHVRMAPSHGLIRPARLEPDSVVVSGAQSLLGTLASWPTEPLTGDNVRDPLVRWVPLRDTLAGLVQTDVRQTLARLSIGEFTEGERTLRVVVRGQPPDAPAVRFEPAQVRATYRVPADATFERAETAVGFVATVDYTDLVRDSARGDAPVRASVPAGLDVRDVSLHPARVGYFFVRPRPTP